MDHSNIFPQIKTKEFIEKESDLVHRLFFPNGLYICYVEDTGATMNYISDTRLAELKLSQDDLHKTALRNLYRLENTENGIHIMDNGDGTKAISYETGDSYDAARIIFFLTTNQSKLDYFIETLGDPFLVAIPCRDFLLAVPASYEGKIGAYAKKLYDTKPFPITSELFMFSKKEETFKS